MRTATAITATAQRTEARKWGLESVPYCSIAMTVEGRRREGRMILTSRVAAGVADGSVSLAFRRWKTLRVKPGNTFRSTAGIIAVGDISMIAVGDITEQQAQAAGASSKDELVMTFRGAPTDPVFKIELSWDGPDPRVDLGENDALTEQDCAELDRRLARLDQSSRHGAWTLRTLIVIQQHPGLHAESLRGDVDKAVFKRNVRKLKDLGLTRSLPEGYELSARGSEYLARRL